jgi:hypothetical protein
MGTIFECPKLPYIIPIFHHSPLKVLMNDIWAQEFSADYESSISHIYCAVFPLCATNTVEILPGSDPGSCNLLISME